MRTRIPIKNPHQEIQLVAKRSMIGLLFLCCFILLLLFRLAFLQIQKHHTYVTQSTKNWLDLVPSEPIRGLIYDRHGILLATNVPVFSLDIIPIQVSNLNKTLAELSKIINISQDELQQFKKQLKQHRRFDQIPLKFRLTEEEVAQFSENQYRFSGVKITARLMRYYPFGESFSHVLGYVGRINVKELSEIDPINYSASQYIGKLGIEKFYEKILHGTVGYEEVENDASGKPIRILKETKSIPGKNIYLTIDAKLQLIAEKALQEHRGALVAIEPKTGQVLALVSKPGYDPNNFVKGISHFDYQTLQQSPEKPLFNRALRGLYPFASTIKPYFALAGLQLGLITPDDRIHDPGWFQLSNSTRRYHDDSRYGHGTVNLQKAITSSCDTYFYILANKMGIRYMDAILQQFGFGLLSGIDLGEELPGLVATPEWKLKAKGARWYDGDTINAGIGQGFMQATPLQLATAVATLANRGIRYTPSLLLGSQQPGNTYQTKASSLLPPVQLDNPLHWEEVIKAMQAVVNSPQGTAYRRFGAKHAYTVAGKTGTAQVIARRGSGEEKDNQWDLPEKLRDHHLFIAFAPVENPQIALAIVAENNDAAVAASRIVLDYYLQM